MEREREEWETKKRKNCGRSWSSRREMKRRDLWEGVRVGRVGKVGREGDGFKNQHPLSLLNTARLPLAVLPRYDYASSFNGLYPFTVTLSWPYMIIQL